MRTNKAQPALEYIPSPSVRNKNKRIDNKSFRHTDTAEYQMINSQNRHKSRYDTQNVRLKFLVEKPARDYISSKPDYDTQSLFESSKIDDNLKSLVIYQENKKIDNSLQNICNFLFEIKNILS